MKIVLVLVTLLILRIYTANAILNILDRILQVIRDIY